MTGYRRAPLADASRPVLIYRARRDDASHHRVGDFSKNAYFLRHAARFTYGMMTSLAHIGRHGLFAA